MTRIYIAGPLDGAIYANVHQAVEVATALLKAGHDPFVPHLNVQWAFAHPEVTREMWLRQSKAWVAGAQALVRLPGLSSGADGEVAYAKELGIPVFELNARESLGWSVQSVIVWLARLAPRDMWVSSCCDGGDCGYPCPSCGEAYGARCSPRDCPGGERVCVCGKSR